MGYVNSIKALTKIITKLVTRNSFGSFQVFLICWEKSKFQPAQPMTRHQGEQVASIPQGPQEIQGLAQPTLRKCFST